MDKIDSGKPIAISHDGKILAERVVKKLFDRAFIRGGFVSDRELTRLASEASIPYTLEQIDISPLIEKLKQEGFAYNRQRRGYENRTNFG